MTYCCIRVLRCSWACAGESARGTSAPARRERQRERCAREQIRLRGSVSHVDHRSRWQRSGVLATDT